jgi:hypothetical protein
MFERQQPHERPSRERYWQQHRQRPAASAGTLGKAAVKGKESKGHEPDKGKDKMGGHGVKGKGKVLAKGQASTKGKDTDFWGGRESQLHFIMKHWLEHEATK